MNDTIVLLEVVYLWIHGNSSNVLENTSRCKQNMYKSADYLNGCYYWLLSEKNNKYRNSFI